jgi:hypothetical protein
LLSDARAPIFALVVNWNFVFWWRSDVDHSNMRHYRLFFWLYRESRVGFYTGT